ncbi:hypothetical protein SELSPUOL_00843 [Selenomonas sputigena ATCC 35185]|uniref:Uncharacterized protein n=1 Tax=Selenomonas sputigena (strain ATCC 35185 / DSM 20758 / CCUG 44933 / VPI D19B-28) TaxID=546271 RepID=C9LU36_SELS3|nr:hypothetical protein SELSPUOL_00843 [Selenomonas sputigena ATCC 35185]
MSTKWTFVRIAYYENPRGQARRAQSDWLFHVRAAHNVHKVDVCAYSLL